MSTPGAPDRFNEDRATYTVRGGEEAGARPDFETGVAVIRQVLKSLRAGRFKTG